MEEQILEYLKNADFYKEFCSFSKITVTTDKTATYYVPVTISFGYNDLSIEEMPSGCGALLFSGYFFILRYFTTKKNVEEFTKFLDFVLSFYKQKASIITTVGDREPGALHKESLDKCIKVLESLGFKSVALYRNKYHTSEEDYQHLMLLE